MRQVSNRRLPARPGTMMRASVALALLVTQGSCLTPAEEAAQRLEGVEPRTATIEVGQTVRLRAFLNPPDASVTWTSQDPDVATVVPDNTGDDEATVTGVAPGQAIIEASARDDNTSPEDRRAVITVVQRPLAVTIDQTALELQPGQSTTLSCTITHAVTNVPITDLNVDWTSTNEQVAMVDQAGRVTAVGPGTARITCRVRGRTESASADVGVPAIPTPTEIAGNYALSGTKRTDTCPAGLFPATINNPGPIQVEAIVFGTTFLIRFKSNTMVDGLHTPGGAYDGTGSGTTSLAGQTYTLVERIIGVWRRVNGIVQLNGTLEFILGQTEEFCRALFDVLYANTGTEPSERQSRE